MSNKKKVATKTKGGKTADESDDWDAILAAETQANEALKTAAPAPAPVTEKAEAAPADGDDDDDDGDDDGDAGAGAKKDKRKKKKKGGKKEPDTAASASPAPLSAAAKAIMLRRQQQEEEEARIKKLQDAEDERVRLENERIAAEEKAREDEKERKRKAKQDKKEAQIAAGTYMTKAEKEKAKKLQARLEAMKAAGMQIPATTGGAPAAAAAPVKASDIYKKPLNAKGGEIKKSTSGPSLGESETASSAPTASAEPATSSSPAPAAESEVADDWDADDNDWESNLEAIQLNLEVRAEKAAEDVEDKLVVEKRQEQEKLRLLGIERAKREEELRLKKEEEDRLQAELEQKDREAAMRKENSRKARIQREIDAKAARTPTNLRAPISVIMGHVDTGKTSLLDKIRHTNVQEGEAGGITQQIGVTQFAKETLAAQTQCLQRAKPFDINLPGLLVIDTPGHESFTNLRSRGSSLCDIAILVIDLMHTLEPQTIESLNLLKKRRAPFIVALNKVDRCYGWKSVPNGPIRESLALQDENCRMEFKDRSTRCITALMEQGLNAKLYWENDDLSHTVSLVPTSAVTGEGVPDLLMMLVTLTQARLTEQLMYHESLQCTVLEVKVIEGLGHTVDVVLVNGRLREGDTIVLSTMDGPVVTTIRALLTPPPSREMRVKSDYIHHAEIHGAIGVKIVAPEVGRVIAGTSVLVLHPDDDLEDVMEEVQADIAKLKTNIETDHRGVMVHASTLGALEALIQFLREECKPPIPVSHVNIGPIHKRDVMRANIMNEKKMPEYATILAFDTTIDAEARELAEESNVRIFTADIIYHLFDQFTAYMNGLREARKTEAQNIVQFPCVLKILPQHIFNKKDPIVIGVEVTEGTLRVGTMLCVPSLGLDIGKVTQIENNHKPVTSAKKSTQVSIRITNESNPTLYYGRQFDHTHALYSKISRASIDALKEFFQKDMTNEDWQLVIKLKKVFNIS